MKTNIIQQEKNPFLKREELIIEITEEATPTKEGLIEALGKDKELCVINKIDSNFGRGTFIADITVYENAEAKSKYMTIPKKTREKMKADKKTEEAAAKKAAEEEKEAAEKPAEEAPSEEKPVEETPTEEVKEGEKKE